MWKAIISLPEKYLGEQIENGRQPICQFLGRGEVHTGCWTGTNLKKKPL